MTRKDLIRKIFIGGTVILAAPTIITSCSKDEAEDNGANGKPSIDLSNPANSALATAGGTKIVYGILVANKGNDTYIAVDSICTHQGCTVGYNLSTNTFPCPCHGSVFSASGAVLNGPAATPLTSYPVTKSGNLLIIG